MVSRKGSNNVKNLAENKTKNNYAPCTRIGNETENTCAYHYQRERLQGLLLTANEEGSM